MNRCLIVLFCLISFWSIGQSEAYYLTKVGSHNHSSVDLMRVSFSKNKFDVKKAYAFKEEVEELDLKKRKQFFISFGQEIKRIQKSPQNKNDKPSSSIQEFQLPPSLRNQLSNDTLAINGKEYIIQFSFYDDGFVGGGPNQVNKMIVVKGFGTIYSYSNYINGHQLMMLNHKKAEQQQILETIYEFLAKRNSWVNWKRVLELSRQYSFENCLEGLSEYWFSRKNHLQLTKCSIEAINREIHVDVTIKNTSDIAYSSLNTYEIAPSKAFIHYSDSTKSHTWDLLNTHYGRHFKRMRAPLYLKPNEEMSFSYVFPMYYGCGSCTKVTYSGFQIYRALNFQDWLINGKVEHEGVEYVLFPHREIKF